MSISSEIARLQQAKADLATSIENKGVTVPAATTLDGYAALVDSIQGSTLPYDAEIEYLEGSGTQYILTNIPNRAAFSMSIKFMLTSDASYEGIFGSVGNSPRPGFRLYRYNATTLYAQSGKVINVKTTTASIKNVAITLFASAYNGTLLLNSVYESSATGSCNFTGSSNWAIFTSLVGGGVSGTIIGRIYSFTYLSEAQSVDYIPVRVGQTGYLYDRISGQLFGNAGTGSFILGADKS